MDPQLCVGVDERLGTVYLARISSAAPLAVCAARRMASSARNAEGQTLLFASRSS